MLKPLAAAAGGLIVGVGLMAALKKPPYDETRVAARAETLPNQRVHKVERVSTLKADDSRFLAGSLSTTTVTRAETKGAPSSSAATANSEQRPTEGFLSAEGDFFSESRDPSWAQQTESLIVTIAQKFPATRATDVECRAQHCRITLNFPSIEAYNALFRGLAEDKTLAQGGMVASIGEGEPTDATVYMRRLK